jgi:hypothetical protein
MTLISNPHGPLDERIEKISFVKRFSVRRLTRSTPMHHASTTTAAPVKAS